MTKWNCVETRIDNGTKYGRIVRKIIFGDIFANRSQLLSQNPLNNNHKKLLKPGDNVAYYSSTEIREGSFLCSSDVDFYEPQNIVSDLLDNEADLKFFCEENNLKSGNIYSMTIEVFKFLNEKMSKLGEDREIVRPNNTGSIGGNKTKSRKRSAEDFILSDHPGNKVHIPNSANQKTENPFENPEIVEFDFDDSSEKNSDSFVVKPCEAPISKNDKAESKEEKDEPEEIEDIEVIAISSNADDDGIKMETIEVHEEDDDTMTIDKSAEAAMQILNGLNPMAINPLLPPHMTGFLVDDKGRGKIKKHEPKILRGKCIDCPKMTKSKCSVCQILCCVKHVDREKCLDCEENRAFSDQPETIRRVCKDGSNLRTKCLECSNQTRSVCPKCNRPWCKNRHSKVICSSCLQKSK